MSGADLTPEAAEAVEAMLRYGSPVDLPAAVIRDLSVDMPGGLGIADASGGIKIGPTRSAADRPSRVTWAIIPPDSMQPVAQLVFDIEAPTRGPLGGMHVRGTDTTGVVAASITTDPPADQQPQIRLSVTLIAPEGKPIRRARVRAARLSQSLGNPVGQPSGLQASGRRQTATAQDDIIDYIASGRAAGRQRLDRTASPPAARNSRPRTTPSAGQKPP